MENKKHRLLIFLLMVITLLTFTACSKPAGEGGNNPGNVDQGGDTFEETTLMSQLEKNPELVSKNLKGSEFEGYTVTLIDANNCDLLYKYVDSKYDITSTGLTEKDKELLIEQSNKMKENIVQIFEKYNLEIYALVSEDKIVLDYGMIYASVNIYRAYCEYILATTKPFYMDKQEEEIDNLRKRINDKVYLYGNFVICYENSILINNVYDAYSILDSVETRGEYEYIKGTTKLINYTGNTTKLIIPDDVTEIVAGAFGYRTNLEEIVLNEKTKIIGKNAFVGIPELVININLPNVDYDSLNNYKALVKKGTTEPFRIKYNQYDEYIGNNVEKYELIVPRKENQVEDKTIANIYYSTNTKYDIETGEEKEYKCSDYIQSKISTMGYKDIKISFANANNTTYFNKYIHKLAIKNGWDIKVENDTLTKFDKLFNRYNIMVMVLIKDEEPVDIIDNFISCSIPYEEIEKKSGSRVSYEFKSMLENPSVNCESNEFNQAYELIKNNIFQFDYEPIFYVADDNFADLKVYSEFMNSYHEDNNSTYINYRNISGNYGKILIEDKYDESNKTTYDTLMFMSGAFKNVTQLKTLGIYYHNEDESKIVLYDHLFAGKNDIVIYTDKEKSDFELHDNWYANGDFKLAIYYGCDLNASVPTFSSLEMYDKNGLISTTFDSNYYTKATQNKQAALAELQLVEPNYKEFKLNAANHPDNNGDVMNAWDYKFNWAESADYQNKSSLYIYTVAKMNDITLIQILDGYGNESGMEILTSGYGNTRAIKFLHEISNENEDFDVWKENQISNGYIKINGDIVLYNIYDTRLMKPINILLGINN